MIRDERRVIGQFLALTLILFGPFFLGTRPALAQSLSIGAAKEMTLGSASLPSTVTLGYVFENFSSTSVGTLSALEDLTVVFGTAGVDWSFSSISSSPAGFANPGFDGNSTTELIAPSQSLAAGATATITVTISLLTLSNAGPGGLYCNQVEVTAENGTISDLSTAGTDPDPNGDGDPAEQVTSCFSSPEKVPTLGLLGLLLLVLALGCTGVVYLRSWLLRSSC